MPAKRPPLQLFFLFHPKSADAGVCRRKLMDRFVEPPIIGGLRVPVRFSPDRGDGLPPTLVGDETLDLDAAQGTIVVFLADQTMVQTVRPTDRGRQWRRFHDRLKQSEGKSPLWHPGETGCLHVFVVSLDQFGYQLSPERHVVSGQLQIEPASGDAQLTPEEQARLTEDRRKQGEQRRLNEVSLQVAIRAIQMLKSGSVSHECTG